LVEGDKVVTRFPHRGTHTGPFQGTPPTGKTFTATGIHISRLVDGKVAKDWVVRDTLGVLQQLGILSAPGQGTQ
jgi:predicted ester cyclase